MVDKFVNSKKYLLAGVALAVLIPGAAAAEEAAADDAAAPENEIVITASKVDVSMQDASLSATALTADTLAQANVTDITGLNGSVPSLVVARSGGGERIITIRGIGSETPENTNTQPGVSYHVDGVYIFNSIAANAAFIDVGQVEVLRGPQGTTFGQGSTGGTINVVSKQPELDVITGNGEIGVGNYNLVKANAAVNLPIGSTLAIRAAAQANRHDGYAKATGVAGYNGDYGLDDADEYGWKVSALWQPIDDLKVTLTTIQSSSDTHGPAQKNVLDPEEDARVLTQDYPGKAVVDTELYYGVLEYDSSFATFKSITSYQKLHSDQAWDADGLTADLFYEQTYNPLLFGGYTYDHVAGWQSDTESWTQEINLASNTSGPFSWIIGGVYLESTNDQYINEYKGSDDNLVRPMLPKDTAADDPEIRFLTFSELSSIKRKAWAAYFQGTFDVTDQLSVTAGVRYNHDKYSGTSDTYQGDSGIVYDSGAYLQPVPKEGLSTTEWTGKFAVDYKLTPDNMLYASYTRGFKPGGLNSSSTSYNALGFEWGIRQTYQPEKVDSFEIGSKNRFFNDAVQLNLSAFYYKYKDMQFLDEDAILYAEGTANAPSAHIYGLELEGYWDITPHLKFDGSLSALRGEFDEDYYALDPVDADAAQNAAGYPGWLFWDPAYFYPASLARDAARMNINGNDVPKLPDWQGSAALTYTNDIGPGELTARAQFQYRGEFYYRVFNNAFYDTTPSYETVNLFAKYQLESAPVYFSATVTNLFDVEGVNSRFSDPYGSAQGFETYIPPRQAIFSVGFEF